MLGNQLELPSIVWSRLNIAWVMYFAFMALANAYAAYNLSESEWVNFKFWGYAFPIIFMLGQGIYISRHMQAKTDDEVAP
jgi:intracellular septation protein